MSLSSGYLLLMHNFPYFNGKYKRNLEKVPIFAPIICKIASVLAVLQLLYEQK
jgi:hypothetical protein